MRSIVYFLLSLCSITMYCQDRVYELVWADEFEGNGSINGDNWHHQTLLPDGNSWYNGEIQHYTNREDNSNVSNGTLKIVAKNEVFTDQGVTKGYTSARLNSKFAFTYGKVEVRAKLPFGVGTWPAIWTLGQNIIEPGGFWSDSFGTTSWPACGEIDIMEHWGSNQNFIQSAMHTPSSFGNTINKGGQVIPTASDDFHIYTMEWTEDEIVFSVDDVVHYTYDPTVQNADTWPFVDNQYILLNVAILPEIDSSFTESSMEIDFVRIYQEVVLDIPEKEANFVLTYLNPVKEKLSIKVAPELVGARLELRSLLGQKIKSAVIQDELIELDVANISAGTYLVTIEKDNTIITKSIVK